jgi:hypothetical protein
VLDAELHCPMDLLALYGILSEVEPHLGRRTTTMHIPRASR